MKLSMSNIGWNDCENDMVLDYMVQNGYRGLEIAPTKVIPHDPYDHGERARLWCNEIKRKYALNISSMQSIWRGKSENIFASETERKELIDYTKKAIDFAALIGCRNLVFGCPINRRTNDIPNAERIAISFFKEIGNYALEKETCIALEALPPIYNTNYINTTKQAIEMIQKVGSKGFLLNLDTGTMIQNNESVDLLLGCEDFINHVHISEPNLAPIKRRKFHEELYRYLKQSGYDRYVSIEMSAEQGICEVLRCIKYVKDVFGS
ncbi:MAG: sugar phosphate isomerase/epimerase [Lachnospiraceae bacterium]|jgi:sugar phosphate isomerase/epimerase|nr:sugar phosphate isomerase/epimerase [Lachnospiraceae bacterium]